jgi:hypothetical protein
VTKRGLPTVEPGQLTLGRKTIMDGGLAAKYGSKYVKLAAFAIDLDRVRELADEAEDSIFPFGFEVFLIELQLLSQLDLEDEDDLTLLEEACVSVFERLRDDEEPPLGAALLFAVYDAVRNEELPERFAALFEGWKEPPKDLEKSIDELFQDPEIEATDLAMACLEVPLSPPLSPPTRAALELMVEGTEEAQ